nr:TIR domain-containing protein [Methylobacterium sp. L1A1]
MAGLLQPRRRNVFFSFHYADLMRVNVVRLSGEFKTERNSTGRSIEGFYDGSLWESAKSQGPDNIKRLIREGLERTSTVCLLVGSETYSRRWVRYELARSVVDRKGLVAIHVNGICDINFPHGTKPRGRNPASSIGVARKSDGSYYLCEHISGAEGSSWQWYADYTRAVDLPAYLDAPNGNQVMPLARGTQEYDWAAQSGHKNVAGWIDLAATEAGR